MKCFCLNDNGDVEIKNNKIVMTSDSELLRQKVQKILSTNKNEWFGNSDEGINFREILGKNVDEEIVKSNVLAGLLQLDDTILISNFDMELDPKTRKLVVSFTATTAENETVDIETAIGN